MGDHQSGFNFFPGLLKPLSIFSKSPQPEKNTKITCPKRRMIGEVEEMGEVNKEGKTNEGINGENETTMESESPKSAW